MTRVAPGQKVVRWSCNVFCRAVLLAVCTAVSCSPGEVRTSAHTAVASWYGQEFEGRRTASGEPFDKDALSAAHREFPFGTRLKVTNLSNGRSVIVVVNDRGPFVTGRDIDLSYAAAREIGLVGPGTGEVLIEYLGRDESYVREIVYASSRGPYVIQVGSFRESANAILLKAALDAKYRGVYIAQGQVDGRVHYRVRIGIVEEKEEASRIAKALAAEGYRALVIRYDNEDHEILDAD
jgi:peptidoglycan lytic transglycosylase